MEERPYSRKEVEQQLELRPPIELHALDGTHFKVEPKPIPFRFSENRPRRRRRTP